MNFVYFWDLEFCVHWFSSWQILLLTNSVKPFLLHDTEFHWKWLGGLHLFACWASCNSYTKTCNNIYNMLILGEKSIHAFRTYPKYMVCSPIPSSIITFFFFFFFFPSKTTNDGENWTKRRWKIWPTYIVKISGKISFSASCLWVLLNIL